ncbi:MAG: O-antigen ligase family protein [Candidatus Latescibacterota bacterium]
MLRQLQQGEQVTAKIALLLLGLFSVCMFTAFALTTRNLMLVTGIVMAMGLFLFGFLSPRITLYLLIFSMLLSPEMGNRDLSGKGFTIRFEDILLLIMGFAWLAKSALFKNIGFVTRTPLNSSIFIYILVCLISTAKGVIEGNVTSPLTGFLFVLKYFEYFVIFFLTVNNIHSREQIKSLLIAILITYVIVLAVGLIQIPQGERITAPFEGESTEPNTLGGYLLIMFSLTVSLFFTIRKTFRRVGVGILAVLCFIAILYTLSRATWVGFLPLYLALIMYTKKRNTLIAALFVSLAILPLALPETIIERFTYTFSGDTPSNRAPVFQQAPANAPQTGVSFDSSTAARLNSMKQVLTDFVRKPILGYGVTGYEFIDAQYHRVLIETGIIGLFAFLFLLRQVGKVLRDLRIQYHADPLYNVLTIGTYCAFIGLLFHAIGTNTFIIVRIMEPFWCLLGLCMAIPVVEGENGK